MIDFRELTDFYNIVGAPPNEFKYYLVATYQKRFGYKTLVETGTFHGGMATWNINNFDRIVSVELGKDLYEENKSRFAAFPKVELINGDSAHVMSSIVAGINEPAIYYLDAHHFCWSDVKGDKESPILEEIDAIMNGAKSDYIILIDDSRQLQWYMEERGGVNKVLNDLLPKYEIMIVDDMLSIIPRHLNKNIIKIA